MSEQRKLLIETSPLPDDLDARLRAQLTFLVEVDRLKTVLRQSPLAADQRRENDAEHSWHLAMMVTILAEYCDEPVDVGHATQLVLVHDLIEIYAGDTPLWGPPRQRSHTHPRCSNMSQDDRHPVGRVHDHRI